MIARIRFEFSDGRVLEIRPEEAREVYQILGKLLGPPQQGELDPVAIPAPAPFITPWDPVPWPWPQVTCGKAPVPQGDYRPR